MNSDNEIWQQLNVKDDDKESKCPLRKKLIIAMISLSIVFLIGMIVLTVSLVLYYKKDKTPIASNNYNLTLTLIAEVFPDGQRLTAVGINYISIENPDEELIFDNSKLTDQSFSVQERNITSIHTTSSLSNPYQVENGKYIIIELNPKDKEAPLIYRVSETNFQGRKNVTLHIQQQSDIELVNGQIISKSSTIYTNDPDINKSINLIVDDFISLQYVNQSNPSEYLNYNLYVPQSLRNHQKSDTKYPLVLFMHDASIMCNDTRMTLFQGVGATVWASQSDQSKRESFVVAPCFDQVIVNDSFMYDGQYSYIIPMLDDLVNNKYKGQIDTSRIYTTGQSMGCMTSISLMCENTDYFASGMFVAGQWDVTVMENLLNQTFWILVSEADMKAPAQDDKAVENLERLGAKISKARWLGNATEEEKRRNVEEILSEGNSKFYVKFANHTVMPDDIPYNPSDEHMYTWKVAYLIEGVREWLFTNRLAR